MLRKLQHRRISCNLISTQQKVLSLFCVVFHSLSFVKYKRLTVSQRKKELICAFTAWKRLKNKVDAPNLRCNRFLCWLKKH